MLLLNKLRQNLSYCISRKQKDFKIHANLYVKSTIYKNVKNVDCQYRREKIHSFGVKMHQKSFGGWILPKPAGRLYSARQTPSLN